MTESKMVSGFPSAPSTPPPAQLEQPAQLTADGRQPVEAWAKAKGHLVVRPDGSVDVTAKHYWKFKAAKMHGNWPDGFELAEGKYDEAVTAAEKVEVR